MHNAGYSCLDDDNHVKITKRMAPSESERVMNTASAAIRVGATDVTAHRAGFGSEQDAAPPPPPTHPLGPPVLPPLLAGAEVLVVEGCGLAAARAEVDACSHQSQSLRLGVLCCTGGCRS